MNEIVYFGHVIKKNRSDTLVENVVRDFNCKFNSCMADCGCTSSVVKNKIFQQYCMVFYGFQNCASYDEDIERLYVTSSKVLRILWRLPYQTHSALLPHITGIPPLDVSIAKRFVKHVHLGFNHDNSLVIFIFQNTMDTDSRIGQNIKYLAHKCGFYIKDLVKLTCTGIISRVCGEWKDRMTEDNVRVAEQVKELVYVRDGMDDVC